MSARTEITTTAVALLLLAANLQGVRGQDPGPLAGFEPYIGEWQFSDEFLADNEGAAEFFARTYAWGPVKNIVRLGETVHKQDPDRRVFEGFAFWHPVDREIRFAGYNVQQLFYFEGRYVTLEPQLMVTEYTVYYPQDFEHGTFREVRGPVRRYRTELRLADPNTLEGRTFMNVEEQWVRWPSADASPSRMRRARPTGREPKLDAHAGRSDEASARASPLGDELESD